MKGNVFASLVSITNGLHRDNRSEREFDILNSELKETSKVNNAVFKVNFKRPLNSKKEYYFKLISNDTETELGALKSHFPKDATEPENKYNYTVQFNKLNKYLKDIANYIKKQSISNDLSNDIDYIINYLKVSAIRLYIELQEQYGQFSETTLFSIQEIAEKYFNDTDFDTSVFVKLEVDKKEVVKKPSKPKSKLKTSFGYKNRDTSNLLPVIKQLHFRIELLDNRTTPEQLEKLLLADNFNNIDYKIYLQCETTQFSYIVDVLKPFFTGFNPTSIERSGKFITKTGTPLKANNLHKNKVHNPKEKEEIDNIIQQLQ
ncbi:DUF6617 family protein [Bizionia sp.]|uniref:DUF6617 family protein n=1 Tax=Bizionia sp. TaxID=1954480 RepID=UPI00175505D7|nr:hypothetical protein [Flavobacteriaceae bacterium]|tara:strand:+ start:1481 stop:2431 length:951 start_codon:yes stop_codon:yes gene_type:complete